MSHIVATRDAFSVELQDTSALPRYWFEIPVGGLDARADVRGTNSLIPGRPGQTYRPKVEHEFPLVLHGFVGELAAATYLELMDDLHDVFQLGAEVELELFEDAWGVGGRVPAGLTATTTVEVLRFTGAPAVIDQVRMLDIECAGITDPLGWTIT